MKGLEKPTTVLLDPFKSRDLKQLVLRDKQVAEETQEIVGLVQLAQLDPPHEPSHDDLDHLQIRLVRLEFFS